MVVMMMVVMPNRGVGRNHRASKNDKCDGSKEQ